MMIEQADKELIKELVDALESALKTANFEHHPFRPWQAKARSAIEKAKGVIND